MSHPAVYSEFLGFCTAVCLRIIFLWVVMLRHWVTHSLYLKGTCSLNLQGFGVHDEHQKTSTHTHTHTHTFDEEDFSPLGCDVPSLDAWFQMPDCWLEVSIQRVLRPATSTQVFLGFPLSISECWDGSQVSKLLLHASHVALQT